MKKTLIFITALVSCTVVMAAETPQPQWQPAQSLSSTPTTALPPAPAPVTVAQPAVTSPAPADEPAPESAATGSAPPAPVPPDAALQYAENVTAPLSPEAIKQLRSGLDGVQRSSGTAPVTAAPRIRS
ncbi:conjugal transfer protein TraN, partial [Salmonella enterica]|nr:conjugal transfer protein TraN [Salmonella enterica]